MFRPKLHNLPSVLIEQFKFEPKDFPNFEDFTEEFNTQFTKGLKKLGYESKSFWISEAGRRLNRSRKAYQRSITVSVDDGLVQIKLAAPGGLASKNERWLALAVEQGLPSYDLKPGFLKGGKKSRVIPLDTKYDGKIFRTVKATGHENKWIYPGLRGLNLRDTVIDEVNNVLIPKYVQIAFDNAIKKL